MDDVLAVGVVERLGNLNRMLERLPRLKRSAPQALRRVSPSRYSKTRKSLPSACPVSYKAQM
jgi:hypothetical protein